MEIWKAIPGFDGAYEVSNLGHVRSLDRIIRASNQHGVFMRHVKGTQLKPNRIGKGYSQVKLYRTQTDYECRLVHLLVAECFMCEAPSATHQMNHVDGIKSNNHVDNLEWCTPKENIRHAIDMGLRERCPAAGWNKK